VVANVQATFCDTFAGTYQPLASAPVNSRFVRVTVQAGASWYFLPLIRGISRTMTLSGTATAGQGLQPLIGEGVAPFSPDAHIPTDPNFGFTKGNQYTLKWPPKGQRGKKGNTCAGDGGFTPPNSSSDRGYIDVGQGNGNSALHDTIVNKQFSIWPSPTAWVA
jgi:hypothetical protein